ncbi:MAG: hypothetical protein B6245_16895 [Desulfobacteraceae bacterium 4572_88]|nr:MAG: hypothetical protein B6245_16895 [Desulfobacteraceae bacterium 4572_88]
MGDRPPPCGWEYPVTCINCMLGNLLIKIQFMALGSSSIIIITLGVPGIIFPKARIKNHANLEFQTKY